MQKNSKHVLMARVSLVLVLTVLAASTASAGQPAKDQANGALGLAKPVVLDAPEASEESMPAEANGAVGNGLEWPSFGADVTFANKYVWRGILLTDGPVMQPSITVGWYGFTFNIWGNVDLDDVNGNHGQFNEVDYSLDYTMDFLDGLLSGSVGFIVYDFPNTAFAATTEIYLGVAVDCLLSPSLTVYFDIDEINGVYMQGAIGHSFDLGELCEGVTASVDLGATLGWGSDNYSLGYFGIDKASFTDYSFSVGMPVAIGDHVTVTPGVTFTGLITNDMKAGVGQNENVIYGVNVGVSF